jgi:hypothetical protein
MRGLRAQVRAASPLFVGDPALLDEVRRSVQGAPSKRPRLGRLARILNLANSTEGVMTFRISQRGKQYLQTAQTLLRTAQTITDTAVANRIKALADDYQRRAEKASRNDAARALARLQARAKHEEYAV